MRNICDTIVTYLTSNKARQAFMSQVLFTGVTENGKPIHRDKFVEFVINRLRRFIKSSMRSSTGCRGGVRAGWGE